MNIEDITVYICDTSDFTEDTGLDIGGYLEVDNWNGSEEKCKAFIKHALNTSRAYSLRGFQEAVNLQLEDDLSNSYILILPNN